jgi:itaconyl-CoA hydratase
MRRTTKDMTAGLAPPEIVGAPVVPRGRTLDGFRPGDRIEHRMRRTLTAGDNALFTTSMLAFNPLYVDAEAARAQGHPDVVVNPMLVFCCVLGLTVEDLSEISGAFLGLERLRFGVPVHPGDTLEAVSEVLAVRESNRHPGMGIVSWRTEGRTQTGATAVVYERTNLIPKERP